MARRRVLFVCLGNSCRSQMAEGFARRYGSDVMDPASAGLSPARTISPLTRLVMREKNIELETHFPKGLDALGGEFDLIVNMSGYKLPAMTAPVNEWNVEDPIGEGEEIFREVRDQIEHQVMHLILALRRESAARPPRRSE
jgi:protein-tyrosine-phosphatase